MNDLASFDFVRLVKLKLEISDEEKLILRAVSEEYVDSSHGIMDSVFGERQKNLESLCDSEPAVQFIWDTLTKAQGILNSSMYKTYCSS